MTQVGSMRTAAPRVGQDIVRRLGVKVARPRQMLARLAFVSALFVSGSCSAAPVMENKCRTANAVQILGSGGPIAEGHRAGTSAVVWRDGKAALLVDAGSGAFVRYGEAGIQFTDHDAILITHFHADHVSDLAAILNSGGFAKRSAPLPVIGPEGNGAFPGVSEHLLALFDEKTGAFRYLSGFLDGRFGLPLLQPRDVDADLTGLMPVFAKADLRIAAIAVHHGDVPALGYVIETGDKTIIFAGDQSFLSESFVEVLADSRPDYLIMNHAIPEGEGQPRGLHRWPESIGAVAAAIKPGMLILSHNMKRALDQRKMAEAAIRRHFDGELSFTDDLDCFAL